MPRKTFPTGIVGKCQCGAVIGCMDLTRTPSKEGGQILTRWIREGLTLEPRWGEWSETISTCTCP